MAAQFPTDFEEPARYNDFAHGHTPRFVHEMFWTHAGLIVLNEIALFTFGPGALYDGASGVPGGREQHIGIRDVPLVGGRNEKETNAVIDRLPVNRRTHEQLHHTVLRQAKTPKKGDRGRLIKFQMPRMDDSDFVASGHKSIGMLVYHSIATGRNPGVTRQQERDFHEVLFVLNRGYSLPAATGL